MEKPLEVDETMSKLSIFSSLCQLSIFARDKPGRERMPALQMHRQIRKTHWMSNMHNRKENRGRFWIDANEKNNAQINRSSIADVRD